MYFIYILQSLKDLKTYAGYSNNIERRLKQHNSGQVRATKHRTPFKLLFTEEFTTETEAKNANYIGKVEQEEENLKNILIKINNFYTIVDF